MNSEIIKQQLLENLKLEQIISAPNQLSQVVENSSGVQQDPDFIVLARTKLDIQNTLKIARQYQIPIYPISQGRNWGYGSKSPYKKGGILLDLSGMNQILSFDHASGVVTVEPGVTQQQLFEFLESHNSPFLVPTTGAGPQASILGNTLEHGFGITPICDHTLAMMSLEAILADGTEYRRDFAEKGAQVLNGAFKWSLGPYLDGIFTQSNLGIVTQMSIALQYRHEAVSGLFFSLKDESYLPDVAKVVQNLMHVYPGAISGINLMNSLRIFAMSEKSFSQNVLNSSDVKAKLSPNIREWTGAGTIYTEKCLLAPLEKAIKKALKPYCHEIRFIDRKRLKLYRSLVGMLPKKFGNHLLGLLHKVEQSLDVFEGKPSSVALPLIYWRSKGEVPSDPNLMDPDKGDIGLIWYAPIAQLDGKKAIELKNMVERVCRAHNIDPLITFTAFNPRVFDVTVPILFNRNDPNQKTQALKCYEALVMEGEKIQCLPYRLGVYGSHLSLQPNAFWNLQDRIKQALDPQNIIAPGRYSLR